MLRLTMGALVLTAFLCADSAVQAQRGWGGGHSGHGHGHYGHGQAYYGGGHYGHGHWGSNYGQGYGWNRGYTGWPGGYSYYGQRSYWPGYSSNWYNRGWYSSPSYSYGYSSPSYAWSSPSYAWSGSTTTQSTMPQSTMSSQDALAYGDADDAALGVWISQTGPTFRVLGVASNSPAAQAGIRTGDEIHSIDGKQFNTARELIDFISGKNTDDQVEIEFRRSGQSFAVSAPLSSRAVAYGLSQQQGEQFAGSEQQGQTYSVMRPATDEDAQQLEGEIDSLKQEVHQLRQDLNQMRGGEHQGMERSQDLQRSGPPAPPTELQQFEHSQQIETRQEGTSVQPAQPQPGFAEPFAPPIQSQPAPGQQIERRDSDLQRDTSRDEIDTRRDTQQQFERREVEQRQFEQRETQQRDTEQRNIERDSDQRDQSEQENRTGI